MTWMVSLGLFLGLAGLVFAAAAASGVGRDDDE